MTLDLLERWIGWLGGFAALAVLAIIIDGLVRGIRRIPQTSGLLYRVLHSMYFYAFYSLVYFGTCVLLWRPIPFSFSAPARAAALALGTPLFFCGLAWMLWGRLTLGKNYFVSSSFEARLFADHQLVTWGPFAFVRHPIYLGMMLTGLGGMLLYRTWAMVFIAAGAFGLILRACQEEKVLSAAFGDAWLAYSCRVPALLPRFPWKQLRQGYCQLPAGLTGLLEVAFFFLPSIPMFLWVWPHLTGAADWVAESVVELYAIAVSLWVGLRRWNLDQLGVNRRGFWFSLAAGLVLVAGRSLVILSVDWKLPAPQMNAVQILGMLLFDFALVGIGQELLFRGLIYHALAEWRGTTWAILGSSLAFGLWHLFGQGPLLAAATAFYGLVFALMRWKAGGILGLILVHGLIDFGAALMMPEIDAASIGQLGIPNLALMTIGLGLIVVVALYLLGLYMFSRSNPRPRSI